jgi:hypothetical protein
LITTVPPTVTDVGWMSPIASPATIAYGTLCTGARGVISGSAPTVMPR